MDLTEPGVSDFVLLDVVAEDAFMANLETRFLQDRIYTFIGNVVVSVNPYRPLNIYGKETIDQHRKGNMYHLPPHVFSIADTAYQNMRDRNENQCILITGESGAGKTEASKVIMRYIAAVSGSSSEVDRVKDQLLNSNPVLEAFGNAKTTRNDNSSRFGKYMDLQFDYKGDPLGGIVTNYLLEKSRVVFQASGERNFHMYYYLLRGADAKLKSQLHLSGDPRTYRYTNQSGTDVVQGMNDAALFEECVDAMKHVGFTADDIHHTLQVVAAILNLGNIDFHGSSEISSVSNIDQLEKACACFQCDPDTLKKALTSRTVKDMTKARVDVATPHGVEKACYSRDALAKAVYSRLFDWVVKKINQHIHNRQSSRRAVIGVLDIYGFEILQTNSFEQFCINYCNEKLQQIFIELTLRAEQDEYQQEGIQWTPIKYFNNAVICELIEAPKNGMIAKLDDECLRPGDATAETLMATFNKSFTRHNHFDSRAKSRSDKTLESTNFRLKHYAGDVMYSVEQFIDKNKDLLYKDLTYAMNSSKNPIFKELFPESAKDGDLKRPDSAGTQFKNSMENLMKNLLSKTPHYIRCIKPNERKAAGQFNKELCLHQVRYLGLLENVRVKRAGFCFRQKFDKWLERYKMLCPDSWPHYHKAPSDGCSMILKYLGVAKEEYQLGRTQVFIRSPLTLFDLERRRNEYKHILLTQIKARYMAMYYANVFKSQRNSVTKISSNFRCFKDRKQFKQTKMSAQVLSRMIRGFLGRRRFKKLLMEKRRRDAALLMQTYIRGIQARKVYGIVRRKLQKYAAPVLQQGIVSFLAKMFLREIRSAVEEAGPSWRKVYWPRCLMRFEKASDILHRVYQLQLAKAYRNRLTLQRKLTLQQKECASDLFKGKVANYPESVGVPFNDDYLDITLNPYWPKMNPASDEVVKFSYEVQKINNGDLKPTFRMLVLSNKALMVFDKIGKLKVKHELKTITGVSCSSLNDNVFVVHFDGYPKGDLVVISSKRIEILTKLYLVCNAENKKKIKLQIGPTVKAADAKIVREVSFSRSDQVQKVSFKKQNRSSIVVSVPAATATKA